MRHIMSDVTLDPKTTLRAVLAQRLCGRFEDGTVKFSTVLHVENLLPFYRGVCGLDYQALRQADAATAPSDLGSI